MSSDLPIYHSYEELPLALSAMEIASVLGISRALAFTLMHDPSFPTLFVGKRMLVPRDLFFAWMKKQITNYDDYADLLPD